MQKEKNYIKKYYCYYTIIFACLTFVIYAVFLKNNKSFVYTLYGDGHVCFNSLVYYGRWLREIIITLMKEHSLQIPMWDMSIGYGSDILTTFNWMTLGDPLNLLSIFFSADRTEFLYGFLALLRLYLTGITFSVFGLYQRNSRTSVMCGSMIYAFCGFAVFAGVRDVYFISPMVYLPLLLMGVDKIFKKEKPYLFIIITALAGITNFYYFYMLTIWTFIYGIYRYFMIFGKDGIHVRKIAGWLFKCMTYYLLGTAMAAFLLLPIIMQLFGSERFNNHDYVPLLYSFDYYWKLLCRFISSETMEAWTHLGYTPICLLSVFVLFFKKEKKYIPYKAAFIMCTVFLMLPVAGSLMNAGSYVVNRWVWAFSMLVACIFVKIYPELFQLCRKEKLALILLSTGYCMICLLRTEYRTAQLATMLAILLISLLMILLGDYLGKQKTIWKYLIIICVFLGIAANGIFRFAWFGSNYVNSFVDQGQAWNLIHDDLPSRSISELEGEDTNRYDSLGSLEPMYNTAMNHDLNGTDFYFSLADGTITRYFDSLLVNVEMEHRYNGVDERTILERLAGVRYCIAGNDSLSFIPYGYDKKVWSADTYAIYENENALPIGYTYDSYITNEEYEALTPMRKQQALLQCTIADDVSLEKAEPVYNEKELPYQLQITEGIEILEDRIIVSDPKANLTIWTTTEAASETYILLNGIIYQKAENGDREESSILYTRGSSTKKQVLYSREHEFYLGRDDYLINLGYTDKVEEMEIVLQFGQAGTYYLDSLQVMAQPMELIEEQTNALSENVLESVVIDHNEISGTLNLSEQKLLCMAIPYSKGWKAFVDGTETATQRVNGMFMGIEVKPGNHTIQFQYCTPYVKIGLFISITALICFVFLIISRRIISRRTQVKL